MSDRAERFFSALQRAVPRAAERENRVRITSETLEPVYEEGAAADQCARQPRGDGGADQAARPIPIASPAMRRRRIR